MQSVLDFLQSASGLVIQFAGVLLITILSVFLTRSIRRQYLDYWTTAWVMLTCSLLAMICASRTATLHKVFLTLYFFCEYLFGYIFIMGCRNYVKGATLTRRDGLRLLVVLALATGLAHTPIRLNLVFLVHAAVLCGLFAAARYALRAASRANHIGPGLSVTRLALALLAFDFLHYFLVLSYIELYRGGAQIGYLRYWAIYDLILEILLGFGTVMIVMEDVRAEVEVSNLELIAARDKLEKLARTDPMTEALNRHAFYSLIEKRQDAPLANVAGCVVLIDIDDLKPINDSFGHAVGDAAIREVARRIRSVIRADDLLFRWGGDEFLILLFNISEADVHKRINDLNAALLQTQFGNNSPFPPLVISHGIAAFTDLSQIERAVEKADGSMYALKLSHKAQRLPPLT